MKTPLELLLKKRVVNVHDHDDEGWIKITFEDRVEMSVFWGSLETTALEETNSEYVFRGFYRERLL